MSLRRIVQTGIKWTTASQAIQQGTQLLTMVILAHLLKPADFGVVGMATVVTGFMGLFRDLGTTSAIVQKEQVSHDLLSSLFWLNAGLGSLLGLAVFCLAPWSLTIYPEPQVVPLLQALAVTFLLSGLNVLPQAILERELGFNRLAQMEIAAVLVGSCVGVGTALAGCGPWSLIYQTIAAMGVSTLLLWLSTPWRPAVLLRWGAIQTVTQYSLNLTASNLFFYLVRNTDDFLIGKFWGAEALGYYTLAYRIMLYPLQNIGAVIRRVMFPVFARHQNDHDWFRDRYAKVVGLVGLITFPIILGLWSVCDLVVMGVFGPRWQPTIVLLLILLPAGLVEAIEGTVTVIYQAKGRTDWMFRWGLVCGLVVILAFWLGLPWGIVGVSIAYVSTLPLSFVNCWIAFRLIQLPVRAIFSVLWRAFISSAVMLVVLLSFKSMLLAYLPIAWALPILISLGGIVYVSINQWINRAQIQDLLHLTGLKPQSS
jgi:O-antigen/teichoic acid export membrane protein